MAHALLEENDAAAPLRPFDPYHRPPDPCGCSTASVERARKELQKVDSRLDLWWNQSRTLWEVRELIHQTGTWSYCFLWKGPNGEYRDPQDGFDELLNKLASCDVTRYCGDAGAFEAALSVRRRELTRKKEAEREYLTKHVLLDYLNKSGSTRTTCKPGDHRYKSMRSPNGHGALREAAEALADMPGDVAVPEDER